MKTDFLLNMNLHGRVRRSRGISYFAFRRN